jgi:DNA-binding NtrC family response regulator
MSEAPVLIVAQHAVIGALLGSLVELSGHLAVFPQASELPSASVKRVGPRLILIDSDHPFSSDSRLFDAARQVRCPLLMFSSTLSGSDTAEFAAKRQIKSFTLPIKYRAFVEMIERALQRPPVELPFDTTGEYGASAPL